jgi:predicted nucleotidyltransferase component of viral defense system
MSKDAMSLKAQLRNLSKKKNIMAQILLQNYMFERFLERLSLSGYKEKFVIKGGMLISAIVGIDTRTTMDLDTTMRGLSFSEESILKTMNDICSHAIDDGVILTVGGIASIRAEDKYGGFRVKITAIYDTIETPFNIDVSIGDVITPHPVKFTFRGMFDDEKQIELWVYNIETVISEKLETVLRRGTLNTRPRDFYDIYILHSTQSYDDALLREAYSATVLHRDTAGQVSDIHTILKQIAESMELKQQWEKYRREFAYAADLTYDNVIEALITVCEKLP